MVSKMMNREEITIGCCRTDCPPWNTPSDSPVVCWAYMIEDQCDAYGATEAEAIGNLVLEIARIYKNFPMPYIKNVFLNQIPLNESKQ